jgi:hypothetical protein
VLVGLEEVLEVFGESGRHLAASVKEVLDFQRRSKELLAVPFLEGFKQVEKEKKRGKHTK